MSNKSRYGEYKGDRTPEPEHTDIPAAYWTDLWEYHLAVAGHGKHAYKWSDKPHRLVYDLTLKLAEERMARSERAGWVSVEDCLPPVDVPVLAMWDFSNKGYYECPHVVACYNGRIWHNPEDTDDDYSTPKRWMAIPKAPSGERNSA